MPRSLHLLCVVLLFAIAGPARAATLALEPSATVVTQGSLVEIAVYGTGFPLGADGGDFAISWSDNLSYVGITVLDPPWDTWSVGETLADEGLLDYVDVFSFFFTPGEGGVRFDIATLVLQATGTGSASVSLAPSLVGWSLAGEPMEIGYATPVELEITPVPEPSTLLQLALGIALLRWMRIRVS